MKSIVCALALALTIAACGKSSSSDIKPTTSTNTPSDATHLAIAVTEHGFEPNKVTVKKGIRTMLVFTRTTDSTCAKQVVIPVGDQKIAKDLPLNQPVEIAVTFPQSGEVQYACGMDMEHAVITVD